MTRLQFGLNVSTAADGDPVGDARHAEDLGFDFVSASDHPGGGHASYETWTMLAWIAAGTSRIGIATRVLGVPWRNPALTAKMAETFNRLSGGRLILGLGGGASNDEFRSFGLDGRTPRDNIDGLDEAVRIIRGLWDQPELTFDGRLYRTDRARLEPKPQPPPPIWLGTFGNRALQVTGQLADGWIPSHGYVPRERVIEMRDRVLAAAADAGRAPGEITCAYNVPVRVDAHVADTDDDVVAGTADAVAEQLIGFARIGFTTFNLIPDGPDYEEQVERLATDVIPTVRDGA